MDRTAVFSVIFPSNLPYFRSFMHALMQQDYKDFDLLLVVDGIDDIETILNEYKDVLSIKTIRMSGTISQIREKAFYWLGTLPYNNIIFADSDDMLSLNRVSTCCAALAQAPIVVHDVFPFTEERQLPDSGFWMDRIHDKQGISAEDIMNYNFAGLGNTAIRKQVLTEIKIPANLIAVDWFVFYQWLRKWNGIFLHEGGTLYRQHNANSAGVNNLTTDKLIHIASVKAQHYEALSEQFVSKQILMKHKTLLKRLKTDEGYRKAAVTYLNAQNLNYFWWEETEYIHE